MISDTAPLIAIVDYGIGNLHSAHKGFQHVGANARLTSDRGLIRDADGVVLPGVGAFAPCMAALGRTGLDVAVIDAVDSGRPFMGICVGMQVLFAESDEAPGMSGLGIFNRRVCWLSSAVKRPQIQWNVLHKRRDHPMLSGLGQQPWVYFVHSLAPADGDDVIAVCEYGGQVTAAVARDNVWAAQFHPEKSSATGLRILANFVTATNEARTSAHATHPGHDGRAERAGHVGDTGHAEHAGHVGRTGRAGHTERAERTGRIGRTGRVGHA